MRKKPFVGTPPDYSDPENWLALPGDAALPADVIFLYPTACMAPGAPLICELHDPATVQEVPGAGMGGDPDRRPKTCSR